MQKNFDDFSMQEALRLAKSDAGQQLLALLHSSHGDAVRSAMDCAKAGDMVQAQQALSAFLSDPQAQALLKQLQEDRHG